MKPSLLILISKKKYLIIFFLIFKNILNDADSPHTQDPDKVLDNAIQSFRQKNINIVEAVKDLEKENAMLIL